MGALNHDFAFEPARATLLPVVCGLLGAPCKSVRICDVGCGDGAAAAQLDEQGWSVIGVDPSPVQIATAQARHPRLDLRLAALDGDLAAELGHFGFVVSLDVAEHVARPRAYLRTLFDLTAPGGTAIVSMTHRGYLKYLAGATAGQRRPPALQAPPQLASVAELGGLLRDTGFSDIRQHRVGAIARLERSTLVVARREPAG